MNPYQKAIKQKKFEGLTIEIKPTSREEMQKDAAIGNAAPDVLDDPEMEMQHEDAPDQALPLSPEGQEDETGEMKPEMSMEDAFAASSIPEEKSMGLRARAMKMLKEKKKGI